MTNHWTAFTLCLICLCAEIGLALLMPAYFTVYLPKGAKKQNVWDLEGPAIVLILIILFRERTNWLSYEALWFILPIGAVLGAIVYWRVVDFHYEKWSCPVMVLLGMLGCFILAGQINCVYDFSSPESYILEVEDLHSSGGRNRSYYCDVVLPDGKKVQLDIPWSMYTELEEGDYVRVEHSTGALGIEYANAYPVE